MRQLAGKYFEIATTVLIVTAAVVSALCGDAKNVVKIFHDNKYAHCLPKAIILRVLDDCMLVCALWKNRNHVRPAPQVSQSIPMLIVVADFVRITFFSLPCFRLNADRVEFCVFSRFARAEQSTGKFDCFRLLDFL